MIDYDAGLTAMDAVIDSGRVFVTPDLWTAANSAAGFLKEDSSAPFQLAAVRLIKQGVRDGRLLVVGETRTHKTYRAKGAA